MIDTAFIACGGAGTRLRPLTYDIPKALAPVSGVPVLEHILRWLQVNDIKNIVLGLGYKAEKIIEFCDDCELDLSFEYSIESFPAGTGGCLKLAEDYLPNDFVYMNGDILVNFRLRDMIKFHETKHPWVTLGVRAVNDPRRYGVVKIVGDRVLSFQEKPQNPESNMVNAGIYVVNKSIMGFLTVPSSLEKVYYPVFAAMGEVMAYRINAKWIDVGTPESLAQASQSPLPFGRGLSREV